MTDFAVYVSPEEALRLFRRALLALGCCVALVLPAGSQAADEIPLERLIGSAIVGDVTEACSRDRDNQVTVEDFLAAEKAIGSRLDDRIVLIRAGFGQYWPDRERYTGTAERGPEAVLFASHVTLFGANIPGFENMARLGP